MQIANTNFISSEQLQELELNFKKRYDYGNIKSNTKPEFHPLFRRQIFGKTARVSN